MKRPTRRDVLKGLAVPVLLGPTLGLGACAVHPDGRLDYADFPDYYYDYYYYPHASVYYHPFSSDYYYRRDGRWWRTRTLPRNYWLNKRHRVPLHIKKNRPFDGHDDHYRTYAKPSEWRRDKDRSHRDREDDDRRERRYNTDRHFEYHRRHRD
jgi:hypothetical protein